MKTTLLLTGLIWCVIAVAQQPPQPSKEDLAKMDFWVGKWDLTWDGGKGTNLIEKKLNGRVIQENFEATEGNFKGYLGTSISTFNPRDGKWHQAWADSQGGYIDLIGIMEGDTRIFQMTSPRQLPNGKESISRMRFYDITEDAFTWDWEASTDGGETWNLNWRINYTRAD
ncbi:hypothetical protein [Ekhidna sp.]|uniref:hypothetical protein n=1 Tax=Ekhidna sp. TaxID=2608089 RepID=UPI00351535D1